MAAAERAVHGGQHEPHLHELAGLDTAVDLVGAVALLELLGPDKVVASPPALGGGVISSSHGMLPVPAPAVVELLRGLPTHGGGAEQDGELTTPTGAALLAELVDEWGALPAGRIVAAGVGAGGRERPGAANVLRAVLVDPATTHVSAAEIPMAARWNCWRRRLTTSPPRSSPTRPTVCGPPAPWTCGSRRR